MLQPTYIILYIYIYMIFLKHWEILKPVFIHLNGSPFVPRPPMQKMTPATLLRGRLESSQTSKVSNPATVPPKPDWTYLRCRALDATSRQPTSFCGAFRFWIYRSIFGQVSCLDTHKTQKYSMLQYTWTIYTWKYGITTRYSIPEQRTPENTVLQYSKVHLNKI